MISLQKIQYFCAMVEEGGIHKAARRLGLSQPPLSMALKELENDLGCTLIFRQGKNWIVTEAGTRLYEEGRAILAKMKGLAHRIVERDDEIKGNVRIGFSTSCVAMFQRLLPKVAAEFPHVACQALFADSERLAWLVRQRLIELAVLYLPLAGKEFNITPLQPQRLEAVFSPLLPPPAESEMHLAEVCRWPLMIPRRWNGGGIYTIISHALQLHGLEPRIICFSQDSFVLLEMLESLAAVAILPQCETERKRRLAQRYIFELADPLTPAIVTLKDIWLSRPARKMMELLIEDYARDAAPGPS